MAEDKANALNQANSIKLIMGPFLHSPRGNIDITDALRDSGLYGDDIFDLDTKDATDTDIQFLAHEFQKAVVGFDIFGEAYPVVGVWSELDKLEADIKPIIDASIVNSAQKEAVLRIIHNVFEKYINDRKNVVEYAAHVLD